MDKGERTDDEFLDSEFFHGVGWGRLLLGLSDVEYTRIRERKNLPWRSFQRYLVAVERIWRLALQSSPSLGCVAETLISSTV